LPGIYVLRSIPDSHKIKSAAAIPSINTIMNTDKPRALTQSGKLACAATCSDDMIHTGAKIQTAEI